MRTVLARILTSGVACFVLLLASYGIASAQALHAKVIDSDPKMGSTITQVPTKVTVTTAENMVPGAASSNLFVYAPNGELVSQGNATVALHNPEQMSVALKADQKGVYVVQWKTVSADDGDPDQGAFIFTVGSSASTTSSQTMTAANSTTTTSGSTTTSATGTPTWLSIVIGVVALLVGLGAGFGLGRTQKTRN